MNNFKKLSAIILVFCSLSAFASCSDKTETPVTSTTNETFAEEIGEVENIYTEITEIVTKNVTEKQTVAVSVTDKKGNVSVSVSEKVVLIPQTVIIPQTVRIPQTSNQAVSDPTKPVVPASTQKEATTKVIRTVPVVTKAIIDDTINEKAVGISMLTKSDPVQTGNYATVFIQGIPGKTYSIDFYQSPSVKMKSKDLENKTADENGFVSWSFEIKNDCSAGKRKVVIKETNSNNYLETSITVR